MVIGCRTYHPVCVSACRGVSQYVMSYEVPTCLGFPAALCTDCFSSVLSSLSLRFNGYFPGEPGLVGVY